LIHSAYHNDCQSRGTPLECGGESEAPYATRKGEARRARTGLTPTSGLIRVLIAKIGP
jgi:hypothetical protein